MTARREHQSSARRRREARRSGVRRWSGIVAAVTVLLLLGVMAAAAFSTLSLKEDAARADIEARLTELTGLSVTIEGAADFKLLPKTQLSLTNIRIGPGGGDADSVMAIDGIVADLDLWQALFGHTRIERLTLLRPELLSTTGFVEASTVPAGGTVAAPQRRHPPTTGIGTASAAEMPPGYLQMSQYFGAFLSRFGELHALDIRDGVFRMAPESGSFGISNANLSVSWPSDTSAARMTGSYIWNGQPTEVDLRLVSPLDFLNGGTSAIDFAMSSPPLTASFDGEGAMGGAGRFSGTIKVGTPSLTRSIRWLGDPRAVMPELGPMAIEATLEAAGRNLDLRNASVTIAGFTGDGAMEMRVGEKGRPSIGGTLAFDRLDLTGFAEAIAPLPQNPIDLQRTISVAFIDHLDLDLRLSAARGDIGTLPISDLAATVKFKDGVATLDVGDATMLGGRGQARISVDSRATPPSASGFASVAGIDTPALLSVIGVTSIGVSGLSDISAELDAPVTNWAELFRRNQMKLDVVARGGALSGFDPNVFLGEGTKPFALATQSSAIPFQTLRATLSTSGPLVDLDTITLKGTSGAFEAQGVLSTQTNQVDLTGSFTPEATAAAAGALTASKPIGFRMWGEWPRPTVTSGPPVEPI